MLAPSALHPTPATLFLEWTISVTTVLRFNIIISNKAEAMVAELRGQGFTELVTDHVLRKHTFPLFIITILLLGMYIAYIIVGDPLLKLLKVIE